MLIYDWEIFKHNSLLGVLNIDTDEVIQSWDIEEIKKYTREHLDQVWIRI